MATIWQYPRTWAGGELANESTASLGLNRDIRDNMRASQAVIAETVVTSTTPITIYSLTPPSTVWNNLKIIGYANGNTASLQNVYMTLNTDNTTVYQMSLLEWNPTSSAAGASTGSVVTGQTAFNVIHAVPGQDLPLSFATMVINISGVNSTRHKLITSVAASYASTTWGGAPRVDFASGIYRSTAAITTVQLTVGAGNAPFSTGSILTMIGLP